MHDDNDANYHSASAYVHIGCWAFTEAEIWAAVDALERHGFSLGQIGGALSCNWPATVTALVLRRTAVLRALIDEALCSRPPSPRG
jgi:hypothetical protein